MRRRLSRTFCPLAVSFLAACGGSVEAGYTGDRALERLTLVTEGAAEFRLQPTMVAEWSGADLLRDVIARGGTVSLKDGRLVLGPKVNRITLTGIPSGPFDRLVIQAHTAGGRLRVYYMDGRNKQLGEMVGHAELGRNVRANALVVASLENALPLAGQIQSLGLVFANSPRPPEITSIRLYRSVPETWLPAPDAPKLYAIDGDSRRAVGLSSRRPLVTTLSADQTEGALTFSFAMPAFIAPRGDAPELVLTVADRAHAKVWEDRYPVPVDQWETRRFFVPEEARGHELEVRFELAAPGRLAVCALSCPVIERREADPRTVLLITSDTHRADHLGLSEGSSVRTPFLDRIANRGLLFEDCQAEGNNTNPTHLSIMTGLPVRDHSVIGNDTTMSDAALTLAECFQGAGFHTYAAVSAAHLTWSGCGQGFDRLTAPRAAQRDSKETIGVLEGWLEESKHRSLFVWLHVFDAHAPYTPPAPFRDMYWKGAKGPEPEGELPKWAVAKDLRQVFALYQGEITYLDNRLDLLFRAWPRLESGVVALAGDHGENMAHPNKDWSFSHRGLSAHTLHVPVILNWPGAPQATRVSRPVQQRDLGRTLLDLGGLGGVDFPGENLVLLAEQDPAQVEELARFAIAGNAFSASIHRGDWFLVQGLYTDERENHKRKPLHEVSLFDLAKDPGCRRDLVEDNQELACALRTELVDWLMATDLTSWSTGDTKKDAETLRHLASLGYSSSTALSGENPWLDPDCDCEHCQRYPLMRQ